MSWYGRIEATAREDITRAIERFNPLGEGEQAAAGVEAQIAAAKAAAHHLLDSGAIPGEHYALELAGHANQDDQSSPNSISVKINEIKPTQTVTSDGSPAAAQDAGVDPQLPARNLPTGNANA